MFADGDYRFSNGFVRPAHTLRSALHLDAPQIEARDVGVADEAEQVAEGDVLDIEAGRRLLRAEQVAVAADRRQRLV